ncbi:phenylalanine-tRNA ligase, alpha subunit [Coccidioides immitis RS]|uniref:Phenylalanine--tRNA ligase alpha subunit n=3 Tax=Coccidioides immitis TaxID=5501 RepID=J3KDM0_COCIM|nr:phenylalanine-tRNA ligase, alpha subunit [Coccidioides immitis RS]EAS33476.3 phenylalanine-tRNA ligase, alpha subunit [Coccidioides immitis RS]KMP04641.1 phenylalanyl-tRNA synthetase alpha chain [Coccidioides immitis RMSCC 2394]KMU80145.1 phenylalanyl-tRNA synthetase alpha chain [Coccidioides immitis RMSCC 3703]
MASDLTHQVLEALASTDKPILSSDAFPSAPPTSVKSALDRLGSREMVQYETLEREEAILSPEAEGIVANGSHEAKVFEAVRAALDGLKIAELPNVVGKDAAKVGAGNAFKKGWIKKDKDTLRAVADSIEDTAREQLHTIQKTKTFPDAKVLADLRKRKLITMQKVINYRISKGPKYAREFVKEQTDLTVEMLADGSWKTAKLKPYNFNAKGAVTPSGAFHPLNKVRHEFRQIFFEMGFEEMPTNRFVETGFWNFDALFVPQQHPARDLQDTFYISDPAVADKPRDDPKDHPHVSRDSNPASYTKSDSVKPLDYERYWNDIHAVHETGKYGSIGYRYPWCADESLRLVLRTHTTAVSAYMLHKLAQNPRPARYFSIDRVFRNEAVDATHLAEFHQIEGVIADFGLSLGGLIGFMEVFFAKMGIHGLRFKPAYNPYTEPSLEIFGYHPTLKRWVEIGNSGMFRPEMLEPMGLPKDMRVYGWGLSLERPTMIKYGVSNIRELLGHKTDLNFIESNPAVRLEKD